MPKYDGLRKPKLHAQVVAFAAEHTDLSQAEIGAHFGMTASNVCRILQKAHKK